MHPAPRHVPGRGRRVALALLACLLPIGPALAEIPHVANGPDPAEGVHALEVEEIWRRGGLDDEEVLFGLVMSVVTDDDGNVYVLDHQLTEVMVFGPDGAFIGSIGREGDGPGEFRRPVQIARLPGGTVGVAQPYPGKVIGLNPDGTPARDVTLATGTGGGMTLVLGVRTGGDNLVVLGAEMTFDQAAMSMSRHLFIRSYGMDGAIGTEYVAKEDVRTFDGTFTLDEAASDFAWYRNGVDCTGRVLVAEPREDYEISVYAPDGELERVFGREYASMRRNEAMRERFQAILDAQLLQLPPGTESILADHEADIWGIHCPADGTAWVTTSRGMYDPPPGAFTMWDVFSPTGEFVRQVTIDVPGKPATDMLMLTDHGYAVMVKGYWDAVLTTMGVPLDDGEAEPMEIVCYRILDD